MAHNRIRKGVLTPLFISVLVLSLCSIGLGIASAQTAVSIEPLTKTVDQGETFNLNISVDPAVAITGVQCDLSFNSSLVTVNSITEGNLLSQDGAGTVFMDGTIDNVAGTVTGMAGAIITTSGETVSTDGVFAIVSLTANEVDGTTGIDLSNVIVGNITGDAVDIEVSNGTVIVAAPVLTTITVLPATADLTVGNTQTFTATAYDQYGTPMAGIVITWTSTTPAVGTVDPVTAPTGVDGTATTTFAAVAEGATTVAATNGDVHDTAAVTVLEVGDVNVDGYVNVLDMILIGQHWGETGTPGWIPEDVNVDGYVNVLDMILIGQHWTG